MKNRLYSRFVLCYLVIGVFCFFLVIAGGSYLVERHLETTLSETLYREATAIASNPTMTRNVSSSRLELIQESLKAVATFQDSDIWIINSRNQIIVSTAADFSLDTPIDLKEFDPINWSGSYYQVGSFFGCFTDKRLSVIAPITLDMTTRGYVAIHAPMAKLYANRSRILAIMQVVFLLVYLAFGLLLVLFRRWVYKPLRQITQGAMEFANGNLSYQIRLPEKGQDEMSFLANTLDYMAEKLNKNGEFQRRFISDVSHDFRSPLTSIKGYVEAMLDGTIPPEFQEKYLKIISFEASRLEKLTRSLLTLNELDIQKRMLHLRPFDINEVVKSTAAAFEGICRERTIMLELYLSGQELFVKADMDQIQQVLYNLLDNAIKFSPDDSSIILETTEKNDKVFVSVKDHGAGIPKSSLPKIWERFYKSDASRGKDRTGTGLGLAIVREIIHAHGENINVISTEGVGTEFIFSLKKTRQ